MRSAESPVSTPIRGSGGGSSLFSQRTSSLIFDGSPMMSSSPLSPLKTPDRQMSDRFIPERDSQDTSISHFLLVANNSNVNANENTVPRRYCDPIGNAGSPLGAGMGGGCGGNSDMPTTEPYTMALSRSLFPSPQSSVLGLHHTNVPQMSEERKYSSSLAVVYQNNKTRNFRSNNFRVIAQTPEKILDAPEMLNDFYLNLIDWSVRDVLAVALNQTTYLWCSDSGSITQLSNTESEGQAAVTGVSWNADGTQLAVGLNDGDVQLWDTVAQRCITTVRNHQARVCSLSWNGSVLASGSRDTTVCLYDTRDNRTLSTLTSHKHEVCGLKWSPNGTQLATGGNDNHLYVYDYRRASQQCSPLWQFSHNAAVKALAWNPVHHNLLLSGGGSADQTLRFWSTRTGECLDVVNTHSQVSGVLWNHAGTEFVSSHGYSDNRLTVWKYPSMKRLANLTGHTHRVLHLALSPDGQTVVSAAGDETIRFWRCFPSSDPSATKGGEAAGYGSPTRQSSAHAIGGSAGSPRGSASYSVDDFCFEGESLR